MDFGRSAVRNGTTNLKFISPRGDDDGRRQTKQEQKKIFRIFGDRLILNGKFDSEII